MLDLAPPLPRREPPSFNFGRRCAHLIATGEKRQMVRADRPDLAPPPVGSAIRLYEGERLGRYRRLLMTVTVTQHLPLRLSWTDPGPVAIDLGGRRLDPGEAAAFARADGFRTLTEFDAFYALLKNDNQFRGYCLRW